MVQTAGSEAQAHNPGDWSIRMEVLKCLNQSVQNSPGLMESQFMVILGPLWQTFVSSLRVYTQASIEGIDDPYDGRYDSNGAVLHPLVFFAPFSPLTALNEVQ
nr:importin-9 isoform X2 [Ipomoea batatas]GMC91219.1 importin-9 isoform X2 [Ipomoea batatas]